MAKKEEGRDLSYGCDDWLRERGIERKEGIDIEETFARRGGQQRGWQCDRSSVIEEAILKGFHDDRHRIGTQS